MHYHIILTELCNSKCRYCYDKSRKEFDNGLDKKFCFDFSAPCKSEVNIEKLKSFIEKDKEAVIVFYGGEPLMEIEKIKKIMDSLDVPFRIQTNGKLIHELPFEYINRIDKMLVSLDGDEERTDMNRGEGTYEKVMGNISNIKNEGYSGEIIARMTIAQDCPDLYEQVMHLIDEAGFSGVHWQLDVGFYKHDFDEDIINAFLEKYNKSVSDLVEYWISEIENGRVLKIYPFLGIINRLLGFDKDKGLMCGAGVKGYAITTNGAVVACPIMNSIKDFEAGHIEMNPHELKRFKIDDESCEKCDEKNFCGGRCMYWKKANLWPDEGNEMVCDSIKCLIAELRKNIPRIRNAITSGLISEEDFEYEKYFGPEIIP